QVVTDDNYKGDVKVLFEVDKEGKISVIYADAVYDELKSETKRVFDILPKIQPGTYNGNPTYFQYSLSIKIPLVNPETIQNDFEIKEASVKKVTDLNDIVSKEFDSISNTIVKYQGLEYQSQLNIPFTHTYY